MLSTILLVLGVVLFVLPEVLPMAIKNQGKYTTLCEALGLVLVLASTLNFFLN